MQHSLYVFDIICAPKCFFKNGRLHDNFYWSMPGRLKRALILKKYWLKRSKHLYMLRSRKRKT